MFWTGYLSFALYVLGPQAADMQEKGEFKTKGT